jgi:hypothetical protein
MKRFLVLLVYLITLNSDLFASRPTFINIITNSDTIHYPTLIDVSETEITKVTAKLEKDVKKLWFNQKFIYNSNCQILTT